MLSNVIPMTTIQLFEPCFEFQESCLSLAWKVSSLNKQCGDKTYLLRSSSLSCALKFASLVACLYSAFEHLWIWLSVGVFRRSLSPEVWSLNSDYLLSRTYPCINYGRKVQIKVYALYVYHFRCQLLAFALRISLNAWLFPFVYVNKKSSHANCVRIIFLKFIISFW